MSMCIVVPRQSIFLHFWSFKHKSFQMVLQWHLLAVFASRYESFCSFLLSHWGHVHVCIQHVCTHRSAFNIPTDISPINSTAEFQNVWTLYSKFNVITLLIPQSDSLAKHLYGQNCMWLSSQSKCSRTVLSTVHEGNGNRIEATLS